jgi:hypothetical protein
MYKCVTLTKPSPDGIGTLVIQNTWVRSEIAVVGAVLDRLECSETGQIRSGWKVVEVADVERDGRYLLPRAHRTSIFGSLEHNRTRKDKGN